jgi:drug/metabolite transporter (DMT)-like permease
LCGLFLALDLFFWHRSIHHIGPGLATILGNFQVFLLAGLGVVCMGEKVSPRFFLAILLAILGLFLVVGIQWNQLESQYKTGVYLGLAAAVAYTAFLLSLRKLQAGETEARSHLKKRILVQDQGGAEPQPAGILKYVEDLRRGPNAEVGPKDFFEIASNTFYGMTLVSFATAIFLGLQAAYSGDSFVIPDIQSWTALLLLGLTTQAIGWNLISNALPRLRASFAGLILLLQPSLAFVWDVLLFQRPTSTVNWIGVIMAITAIYLGTAQRSGGS